MKVFTNLILDNGPGDLASLIVGPLHTPLSHVVEAHHVVQHAHGFIERAVTVVLCEGVLLEEVILDQLGYFQRDLVRFCK